jgi:hypothetical protein
MRVTATVSLASALLLASLPPAAAERIPPLSGEFAVEGAVMPDEARMPMTLRHRNGVVRVELVMQGQAMTTLLDLSTRRARAVMAVGGRTMVVDMQLDQMPAGGNLCVTEGTRVASSTVLGEPCDEYETSKNETESPTRICITRDGIPLRAVEIATGRTTWMATRVRRGAQDPALFQVPPGAMRLPGTPPAPSGRR